MRRQNFSGFPLLLIGQLVIGAASAGWDYYRAQKQIQQQIQSAGVQITPADISAVAGNVAQQAGPNLKVSRQDLEKYLSGLIYGTGGVQQPPGALFYSQQPPEPPKETLPTWAWIAFGVLGFFVLQPMLMKGG